MTFTINFVPVSGAPGSVVKMRVECFVDFIVRKIVTSDGSPDGGKTLACIRSMRFDDDGEDRTIEGGVYAESDSIGVFVIVIVVEKGRTIDIEVALPQSGKFACMLIGTKKS